METTIDLLTREEAARELNVNRWTILRWQKQGRIAPAVSRGERGTVRYERVEVERVKQCHIPRHRWQVA